MNEILQKRIEEVARHYLLYEHKSPLNEILHQCNLKTEMQYHKDIENAFIAGNTFALQNQWISVDEALPPEDNNTKYTGHSIRVFVRVDFNGQISYCNLVYIYEQNKWSMYDGHITHWMPIPKLKGDEK